MNDFYAYTDKALKYLRRFYIQQFRNAQMQIRSDRLNVVSITKGLYNRLENETIRVFKRIAREKYKELSGHDFMVDLWLLDFLSRSNPVAGYVWKNDVERKRQYCAESLLSDEPVATAMKKALRYWYNQQRMFADLVTDAAAIQAFEDNGVSSVMWVTAGDERVCSECDERDGHIYPITNVPAKPHPFCRCTIRSVR